MQRREREREKEKDIDALRWGDRKPPQHCDPEIEYIHYQLWWCSCTWVGAFTCRTLTYYWRANVSGTSRLLNTWIENVPWNNLRLSPFRDPEVQEFPVILLYRNRLENGWPKSSEELITSSAPSNGTSQHGLTTISFNATSLFRKLLISRYPWYDGSVENVWMNSRRFQEQWWEN